MVNIELKAELREGNGKGPARALRKEGRIPAVVYGAGGKELNISLERADVLKAYKAGGFLSRVYEVNVGKDVVKALPREIQLHPVKDIPLHVDFQRVTDKCKVRVSVPVKFINQELSPGIKRGGALNIVRRKVEVIAPANAIPEQIEVDLAGRNIGQSVHISSVVLPEGVNPTIEDRDFTICALVDRRGVKAEDETAEEAAE